MAQAGCERLSAEFLEGARCGTKLLPSRVRASHYSVLAGARYSGILAILLLLLAQPGCQRSAPTDEHSSQPIKPAAARSKPSEAEHPTETSQETVDQAVPSVQTKIYENAGYGFRLVVPADWQVSAEPKGSLPQGQSEGVVFALPRVWSELEDANISNAISIKAIRLGASCPADDFAMTYSIFESDGRISSESVKDFARPAYIEQVNWRGLTYKRRLEFEMRDRIGYVLEFTATPGTYDQNYPKFRQVADDVEFFPAQRGSTGGNSP